MSSTNRGYERHVSDFYVTPKDTVKLFFEHFTQVACDNFHMMHWFDPENILSLDIRQNSKANIVCDYLRSNIKFKPDIVVANPPFNLAIPFIKKTLDDVEYGGYVVMLLRLNFFGSQKRKAFFEKNMPKFTFIHHKRISFFPKDITVGQKRYKKGSTDSCEYAHFVWQKGYEKNYSTTFLI